MTITDTLIPGVRVVDPPIHEDDRGTFSRVWCLREFDEAGLPSGFVQCSVSHTRTRGTIRGLHWQAPPHSEGKLVRCVRGSVWDVAVDLRPDSATYLQHFAAELTAEGGRALFIPRGCAHGFQTLTDNATILYNMTQFYEASAARGARWNDPAFAISWPVSDPVLHPRDATYADFHGLA